VGSPEELNETDVHKNIDYAFATAVIMVSVVLCCGLFYTIGYKHGVERITSACAPQVKQVE